MIENTDLAAKMEEQEQPLTEVTITADVDSLSNDDSSSNDEQHIQQSKELAIQTLLEIIDSKNIEIDDQLRRAILGQETETSLEIFPTTLHDTTSTTTARPSERRGSIRRSLMTKRQSILNFFVRKHSEQAAEPSGIEKEICREFQEKFGESWFDHFSFECRVTNGSYSVEVPFYEDDEPLQVEVEENGDVEQQIQRKRRRSSIHSQKNNHIPTVTNVGTIYKLLTSIQRFLSTGSCQQRYETKVIMKDVNLVFEEGKMYLILGPPGCGKSTLLKMIAGRLPESGSSSSRSGLLGCCRSGPRKIVGGNVHVNGVDSKDNNIVWSNVVSYVDQIERLHGYLTVKETVDFAFDCCWGGTHRGPFVQSSSSPDAEALLAGLDKERWMVDLIMRAVGIKRVADTYVGNERVRGVSGGEKKRVSVAEMLAAKACE